MANHPNRAKLPESVANLMRLGIDSDDATSIRRAAMTLKRWYEMECGTDGGAIERDEITGKTYWYNFAGRRFAMADREAGAMKRIAAIMAKYPTLAVYYQTDPRGAPVYILRPGDVPAGEDAGSYYSCGIAVYK